MGRAGVVRRLHGRWGARARGRAAAGAVSVRGRADGRRRSRGSVDGKRTDGRQRRAGRAQQGRQPGLARTVHSVHPT